MLRIRSVLSSLAGAAVAATLAFGIGSAAAQPAAPTAGRAECTTGPGPTPFELCRCPEGGTGYCEFGKCVCDS